MGYLAEEIAGVASELGISIVTVDQQLTLQIKEKLAKKFSTDKERSQILSWQNLEGRGLTRCWKSQKMGRNSSSATL